MRKLTILLVLILIFNYETEAQTKVFKCDGIYQTHENGMKIINKHSESDNLTRDSIIAIVNNDGVPIPINDVPYFYLIDTIPIVCFNDFKSAKLTWQKGNTKPVLSIKLIDSMKCKFANATRFNIGKPLPIIFENKLISAPTVVFAIESGELEITGLDKELIEQIVKKVKK